MSLDGFDWLAEELGLVVVEATVTGTIRVNGPARELLRGRSPSDLPQTAAAVLGVSPDDPVLAELLLRAESGERASGRVGKGFRVAVESVGSALRLTASPLGQRPSKALERRAAAADLAAGVSHEVANALGAIVGWAQLSLQDPDVTPPEEALELIEGAASTAREIARDMLRMVRRQDRDPDRRADLAAVAETVGRLLQPEARLRHVHVQVRTDGDAWCAASRGELFTIVWNLAANAVQALPREGRVSIAVEAGAKVRLVVADDGHGMDETAKEQVFESYFTTRAEGTGLGLPLVHRTVTDLGGDVRLETALGEGAQFYIELPSADAPAMPAEPERKTRRAPAQSGTLEAAPRGRPRTPESPLRQSGVVGRSSPLRVLIVEDDRGIRELMETTLSLRGAFVTAVQGSTDAARITEPHDVALVDMTLLDGRGDMVLADLRERGVVDIGILMSGADAPQDLADEPDAWLRKPFDPEQVIRCVGSLTAPTRLARARLG